jgi:hypothetical protein
MGPSCEDFDDAGAEKTAKPARDEAIEMKRLNAIVSAWSLSPWTSSREACGRHTTALHAPCQVTRSRRANDSMQTGKVLAAEGSGLIAFGSADPPDQAIQQ